MLGITVWITHGISATSRGAAHQQPLQYALFTLACLCLASECRIQACWVSTGTGSLYSLPLALIAVAAISTVGACLNYELSTFLLKDMIIGAFSRPVENIGAGIYKYADRL